MTIHNLYNSPVSIHDSEYFGSWENTLESRLPAETLAMIRQLDAECIAIENITDHLWEKYWQNIYEMADLGDVSCRKLIREIRNGGLQ